MLESKILTRCAILVFFFTVEATLKTHDKSEGERFDENENDIIKFGIETTLVTKT